MTYAEIIRLYEKKDHLINRTNMTNEQKQEVIEFFTKHREQESAISDREWNKPETLTYERFKQVMDAFNNRNTKSRANKIANKVGIAGLVEGKDYVDWGEFNDSLLGNFHAYTPLTHLGAKTIAGKTVKPINPNKDSAGWCIGWSGNDSYWKDYFFEKKCSFLIVCGDDVPTKKICFEIKKNYDISTVYSKQLKAKAYYDKDTTIKNVTAWDYYDSDHSVDDILKKIYNKFDNFDIEDLYTLGDTFTELFSKAKDISDKKRKELLEEEERKEKEEEKSEFLARTEGLEIKNLTYKGYDFPMIEMGVRPEGKVFGSYYLTLDRVPFSPKYNGEKYKWGCNRWDISIVRQWLNSDEPAGQWYKEYEVDGYKVDWDITSNDTEDFIKNTDGFLRIIGLSKSQLTPVKNITYTTEGKEIITEDYIWIPSLTELSTRNKYNEGQPLEYWQKLLGNNADWDSNNNRTMKSCDTFEPRWYWIRSVGSYYSYHVRYLDSYGRVFWDFACPASRLPILACFKSN